MAGGEHRLKRKATLTAAAVTALQLQAKQLAAAKTNFCDRAKSLLRHVRAFSESCTHTSEGSGADVVFTERKFPLPTDVVLFLRRSDGQYTRTVANGPCADSAGGFIALEPVNAS